jgi:hypothetical protein
MPMLFVSGQPTAVFARLITESQRRNRIALIPIADAIKRQAKTNASNGRHLYGTPTPSMGAPQGPAIISRSLVNAIDRTTPVKTPAGWLVQVGMAPGRVPSYSRRRDSAQYAEILELVGSRSGRKFPFMHSAAQFGFDIVAPVVYREMYGSTWFRVA